MYDALLRHRLIPVVEIDAADDALPLAEALVEGGITIVEVTLRTDAATDAIAAIGKRFPEILLGAGTVLTLDDAARVRDAGAVFGVAPGLNPQVAASFLDAGLPFVPGAITPTEVERALELGCGLIKFFPAEAAGGLPFLRALGGPYAHRGIRFCATGGIGQDNMLEYLACPIVAAVGGSWIAPRARIAARDRDGIAADCRRAVERIESLADPA